MYSEMLEEVVQINIYGATITDMKDKGFDIADILSKFGYGIYVIFDVPPKKCLDSSSYMGSSNELSLSMTRVKEEVPDEDASSKVNVVRYSTSVPCPLLDASLSTIAGSEYDEVSHDYVSEMKDQGYPEEESTICNLNEPLQDGEEDANLQDRDNHASPMSMICDPTKNLSDTSFSDSVADCLMDVLDKVCAVESFQELPHLSCEGLNEGSQELNVKQAPVESPVKAGVERMSRKRSRKSRSPQRRLNQSLPAVNQVPNAIRSSTFPERSSSVAANYNNEQSPQEKYFKKTRLSGISNYEKMEDTIQNQAQSGFIAEVRAEAFTDNPPLFNLFADISVNSNFSSTELGGIFANISPQFDLGYSEPFSSSADKKVEAVEEQSPQEEYFKTDKSDFLVNEKVEEAIQNQEQQCVIAEVETEEPVDMQPLFTDAADISISAHYCGLEGSFANSSHQFKGEHSEPSGSSTGKEDEVIAVPDLAAGDKKDDERNNKNMNVEMEECDGGAQLEQMENIDDGLSDDEFFDCTQEDDPQNNSLQEGDDDDEEMADCLEDVNEKPDKGKPPAKNKRPQPLQYFKCHFQDCETEIGWRTSYGRTRFLQHVRTHSIVPVFKCVLCKYRDVTTDKVRNHHRIAHPKQEYRTAVSKETAKDTEELLKLWNICFPQIPRYPEHFVQARNPTGNQKIRRVSTLVKKVGSEKTKKDASC